MRSHLEGLPREGLQTRVSKGTDNAAGRFRFGAMEDFRIRGEVDQMNGLNKKEVRHRGKINLHHPHEARYWSHHLKITTEQLHKLVDKVGNAATAVRKELEYAKGHSTT
jgi:hypothetical protein